MPVPFNRLFNKGDSIRLSAAFLSGVAKFCETFDVIPSVDGLIHVHRGADGAIQIEIPVLPSDVTTNIIKKYIDDGSPPMMVPPGDDDDQYLHWNKAGGYWEVVTAVNQTVVTDVTLNTSTHLLEKTFKTLKVLSAGSASTATINESTAHTAEHAS